MPTKPLSQKVHVLLKEAEEDLRYGCLNKAASATYFAARMAVEDMLSGLNTPILRRDDKLVHILLNLGHTKEAEALEELYILRKKADYDRSEITQNEAQRALTLALETTASIEKIIQNHKHGYQ